MTDRVMRMILLAICATLNFATPSTGLASPPQKDGGSNNAPAESSAPYNL